MPIYFAFGSNMDTAQMAHRCPGARTLGRGTLADHRLVFRGPSRKRGGGVLSVDVHQGEQIEGVLYEVTEHHLQTLDRYEGAPEWYVRAAREVIDAKGATHEVVIYRLPIHVTEMPPTEAYLQQVADAFDAHGLSRAPLQDANTRALSAG